MPPHLVSLSLSDSPLERISCPLPKTLMELRVYNTSIRKLPRLSPCLLFLHFYNTPLDTLPALPTYLLEIDCGLTQITELVLPPNLERLNCDNSQLNNITNFPQTLKAINLYKTRIASLPDLSSEVDALIIDGCLRLRPKLQTGDTIQPYAKLLALHNKIQIRRLVGLLDHTRHLSTPV